MALPLFFTGVLVTGRFGGGGRGELLVNPFVGLARPERVAAQDVMRAGVLAGGRRDR